MNPIVHLRRQLVDSPAAINIAGIDVRHLVVPDDVGRWLALRERAISGLTPAPRPWLHTDYQAEMFDKPWWQAERNWLAISRETPEQPIGTVTLAVRKGADNQVAVVHWLLVDPAWRRRGIGRLLMSHLERAAWDAGWREVALETHSGWAAAVAFYQSMGYEPLRDSSPR